MTLFHPNGKGTGCAMKLELRPAEREVDGSVFVTLSPQKTVGSSVTNPTFDWDNPVTAKLDILELTQMLQVLRGMQESIDDGKGLFHRTADANKVIKFEHRIEPVPGYWLDISEKPFDGELRRVGMFICTYEANAICIILEQAMIYMAFGVPPFGENPEAEKETRL